MALVGLQLRQRIPSRPQIAAWDIGPYEAIPELELVGVAANTAIHLSWTVNNCVPVTTTWTVGYAGPPGDIPSPIAGIPGEDASYSLTGLDKLRLVHDHTDQREFRRC